MTIGTFYNPFSDPQDRDPVSHCALCGAELYSEDICYLVGDLVLCEQCITSADQYPELRGFALDRYFRELYGG